MNRCEDKAQKEGTSAAFSILNPGQDSSKYASSEALQANSNARP